MAEDLYATLKTNRGDIVIQLFENHAPTTVKNFTGLAEGTENASGSARGDRFYDGLVFHRVIGGFMIQGGCPEGSGMGGPGLQVQGRVPPRAAVRPPVPAGDGQCWSGHQRLAVLHHRRSDSAPQHAAHHLR